ncbi:MAG TPA: GAF domain-containing sensor histidine kinase, partial [Ktedonobacterales bacterium]|nr:GAF domain-containing sensor histidine kinase [Ktedonobacterales bacterium]
DARGEYLELQARETAIPGESAKWDGSASGLTRPGASQTPPPADEAPRIALGKGMAGQVAMTAVPLLVNDLATDPRFPAEMVAVDAAVLGVQPATLLCVPLVFKGTVTGVLEVAQTHAGEGFDARDLDLMQTLAAQAATAVANTRFYQDLRGERDRIISAQEDVRKQLARDLHDGPAQALAQIAMQLEFAGRLAEYEPQKVPGEIRAIRELALRTTKDIRNLLFDLRPLVLETEGLEAALTQFLERFKTNGGPTMHYTPTGTARLPYNAEAVTFAIVQEAVNNVLKHARASNCWLELVERRPNLVVTVRDDGVGFNVHNVSEDYQRRGSWGLLNMHERALLAYATLGISSQPQQGTVVMLSVPYPPR